MYALSTEIEDPGKRYLESKQAGNCHQDMTTGYESPCHWAGQLTENKDGARQRHINVLVLGRDRRKRAHY